MNKNEELEREAVALLKQYGFFLPKAAKDFFKRLAEFLGWENLKGTL
jgi:hypothetical protein